MMVFLALEQDQKKSNREPTISAGKVYFPIFKPSFRSLRGGFSVYLRLDDENGTNNSSLVGSNASNSTEKCLYVGQGVLSKPIVYSGTVYSAIAGESIIGNEDLVILPSLDPSINNFRIDWREN